MKLYKLTDANGRTHNNTQWGPNVTHNAKGDARQELCSDGYIHAYVNPELAILFNPIHANFADPQMWESRGSDGKTDGLKVGCRKLTTVCRIPLPVIPVNTIVAFAILCSLEMTQSPEYKEWANNWLTGKDRTQEAARAAAWAAAEAAARAAAWAAEAAVWAAAGAAWAAAEAAARAAAGAERAHKHVDFISILQKAKEIT